MLTLGVDDLEASLRTGSLYLGSEDDARAYREVGLVERLRAAGAAAADDGDVALPSYLPHRDDRVNSRCRGSPERERKRLHARVEKLDLEMMSNMPLRIAEIEGRSEVVPERAPDGKVVIDLPRVSRT